MSRILFVTTVSSTLGAFILPFAHYFHSKGWYVEAMTQIDSSNTRYLEVFDHVWDVKWSRNPLHPFNLLSAPRKISEVITQSDYDIVHVHTPVAAFVTRYALRDLKKQMRCKIIYTAHGFHFYHGGNPIRNFVFLTLEKIAGSWTDYLIVINREDELMAKRYHIVPSEQIRYMPGIGVDMEYYNPEAISEGEIEGVRQTLGISREQPLFLSVAEFIPRKHHQDILKAFSRLTRPNAHLAFAGEGPLLVEMQQLAVEMKINDRVHFLGFRSDIPTLIRASVATLLVSEQEGLPRSVMESLCLKTPVIGTEIRGTQELLTGGCGLLVKVGDIEGLTQAMTRILDYPDDALKMGEQGRIHMYNYDLKHILELHQNLYTEAREDLQLQLAQHH
jgi:glycosyltransferase involved in cell wall biosynthesis